MKYLSAWLIILPTVTALGCGDDPKPVKAPPKIGTMVIEIGAQKAPISMTCYDVVLKDGANTLVGEKKRECLAVGQAFTWSNECSAELGRLTHAVTVHVVAAYLADGTPVTDDPNGPGDLAELVNPCPNGCTIQASCDADKERRVTFDLPVTEIAYQGFLDIAVETAISAETAEADVPAFLCYALTVKDSEGTVVFTQANLCDDAFGRPNTHSLSYVATCDAHPDRAVNTISLSLTGVFLESRVATTDDPGAGVRGEYGFTCDNDCVREVTCVQNSDITVAFAPTLRRIYPVGVANINVGTTVTGDDGEPVVGGCYTIAVANSQDQELVNQASICTEFHGVAAGGPADISYKAQCDSTPWPEGGKTHTASLTVESLYAAGAEPTASGLPPTATIDGLTNPCPAGTPCTMDFECDEDVEATATFALAFEAAPVAAQ